MTDSKFFITKVIVEDHKNEEYDELIREFKQESMINPDTPYPDLPTTWGNFCFDLNTVSDFYEYGSMDGIYVKFKNGEVGRIRETFDSFCQVMIDNGVTICNYSR